MAKRVGVFAGGFANGEATDRETVASLEADPNLRAIASGDPRSLLPDDVPGRATKFQSSLDLISGLAVGGGRVDPETVRAVVKQLLREERAALLEWVAGFPEPVLRDRLLRLIVPEVDGDSGPDVWNFLHRDGMAGEGLYLFDLFGGAMFRDLGGRAAFEQVGRMPGSEESVSAAQAAIAIEWAAAEPKDALQFFNSTFELRSVELLGASHAFANWFESDRAGSLEWLEQGVQSGVHPTVREEALGLAVEAMCSEDVYLATEWVLRLPPADRNPNVIVNLTRHLALVDGEAAMIWNNTIENSEVAEINRREIFAAWAAVDERSAASWLGRTSGIDPSFRIWAETEVAR